VREHLLRIKEHTEGLTREQERAFVKVLAELRAMQQAATGIMISRDISHGRLDETTLGTFDAVNYNTQLSTFSEILEKILADTRKGVGT
jgi:hypothetical protein